MLSRVHIDRRVLYGFLILMIAMNVDVFFVHWQWMMDGKNDFAPLYSSAQMVREGQASHLYDFDAENSFLQRISDIARPPNNHFPYENLIFVPFTYLRFGAAHILWTLVSVGMLVGVALLIHDVRPVGSNIFLTLLPVLAFFPVWFCMYCGQDSILLLLFFALSFWFWKRGQDDVAGFVLALGLFRPQLVLPFVLVAFLGGKWKFVRGFIPGAVLVVALSTWVVGFNGMADYARILISQGTESSAGTLAEQWHIWPQMMPTFRGLLRVCLPSGTPVMIRNVVLLCGTFGALLWAAKRMRDARDGTAFDMAFAVAVAAVTLVSFHSFLWDFSLMILLILIAGGVMASSPPATEKSAYTIVTIAYLFFFTPLYVALLSKLGLLFLPAIAAVWLMSRWGQGSLPEFAANVDGAQSWPAKQAELRRPTRKEHFGA